MDNRQKAIELLTKAQNLGSDIVQHLIQQALTALSSEPAENDCKTCEKKDRCAAGWMPVCPADDKPAVSPSESDRDKGKNRKVLRAELENRRREVTHLNYIIDRQATRIRELEDN